MSTLAESLKRLYDAGRIDIDRVDGLRDKLTDEEYDYIIGG